VKQTVHRGYIVTAISREHASGEWRSRWSAVRVVDASEADSKAGDVGMPHRTESDADEAGLREGCAWVDSLIDCGGTAWPRNVRIFGRPGFRARARERTVSSSD